MDKTEARKALKDGERLIHSSFTSSEWVELHNGSQYVYEDGVKHLIHEFWAMRDNGGWGEGWSIVER